MNDSPDESVPSLSSYPPAFVSLITTFIKRAEEAETRAHKSLVILKSKDNQVNQLQQRMEVLENIACRLEEVVPPLNLPKSPQSELYSPRDVSKCASGNPPLETLYERCTSIYNKESKNKNGHNCYEKCQNLIDGLERSNCQLREALIKERQERVKDHERYMASNLDKNSQTCEDLQNKHTEEQLSSENKIFGKTQFVSRAAGDCNSTGIKSECIRINCPEREKNMAVVDKHDLKNKVDLAESIISVLKHRLEDKRGKRLKNSKRKNEKSAYKVFSKASSISFHSPNSSSTSRSNRFSSRCFLNVLRKQNKKLKSKYNILCEKYTECLSLCEKLQKELICFKNKNKTIGQTGLKFDLTTESTQTEDLFFLPIQNSQDKQQSTRSVNILQGRLEAAAKVMAKQCKQIQNLQKQLGESFTQVECLKKRLARAESTATAKKVLGETTQKQLQDIEQRNSALTQERQMVKDSCHQLRQELAIQVEESNKIKREKEICEHQFKEMKLSLETKLVSLSSALQQKEQLNCQMTNELQNKLSLLREQFIAQVTEASDRLVAADFKIQELYLGIETFLKLLFSLNSPELSPSSQAQAVQVASDILQLPTSEVQTILHTSRYDLRVGKWIRECNRIVHEKVFAKTLGNLLLDAVLESKIT
ncbi:putative leucine-rich repeat-containing protein DDB_G0290503 [Macrosteles quadrilineatus]|uniref:putative leucine-rich repeat-containing protein DDB_G0290503 n=1 Tax=Macrosteles quadrilineatus TaxID=74068 RepID=UPI0023E09C14|nr:putative leucine-rich repeat-containing protein DDB_G0290503 [Macrosteles quadrilineatus]